MKKITYYIFLIFLYCISNTIQFTIPAVAEEPDTLLVDNFEPETNTDINGKWKVWKDVSSDYCEAVVFSGQRDYEYTKVLRLEYKLENPEESFCGLTIKFNRIETGRFKYIVFYIKGDEYDGFPKTIEIELKHGNFKASKTVYYIDSNWQKIAIPIKHFTNSSERLGRIDSMSMIIGRESSGNNGVLFIDDIYFTSEDNTKADVEYYVEEGNRYYKEFKYEEAIREYEKAVNSDPENVLARINLGAAYVRKQQYFKASNCFEKAIEIKPDCAVAHYFLAVVCENGFYNKEEAIKHYQSFLDFDTSLNFENREAARKKIKKLNEQ